MFAVFTGAIGAGKSTTIDLLHTAGCPVLKEIATEVINEGIHQPWLGSEAQLAFQMEVSKRQAAAEARLARVNDVVYLDRGMIDPIAYRLIYGRPLTDLHHNLTAEHYAVAFLFEPLEEWEDNGVRYEDLDFSRDMIRVQKRIYESFDVPVVMVPNGTRDERLALITGTMSRLRTARQKLVVEPQLLSAVA